MTSSPLVASLPMYDAGDLAAANDELWSVVRERVEQRGLRDLPHALTRNVPTSELWSSEGLVLSHICGYPFACRRDQLAIVGAPVYAIDGCTPTEHRSFVVVGARSRFAGLGDLARSTAVVNELESVTGRHLLGDALADVGADAGFFGDVSISGSHAASLTAVARGEADVAAIDCVTHHHLARQAPDLVRQTRILHVTRAAPMPPFVIARACGEVAASLVAEALRSAIDDPRLHEARAVLGLVGIASPHAATYDASLDVARHSHAIFAPQPVQPGAQRMHIPPRSPARTPSK